MVNNKVCSVIVTYNIGEQFYECFYSIVNQVEFIVIVDNGSNKETINVLKKLENQSNVKVIYNFENLGIATALNKGIEYAIKNKYEWILTMDNDSRATNNMVSSMLEWYKKVGLNKNVVSIFPEYIEKNYIKDKEKCSSELYDYNFKYISFDNTSGNLVKSSIFEEIGLFREDFFIDSVDHDFCLRIKNKGYKLVKVKGVKLLHSLGNTKTINIFGKNISCSNHSALRRYYITRNRCVMRRLYKYDKDYMDYDRKTLLNENVKILLFEKDKINKIKMSLKGYKDYKKNKMGKFS